MGIAKDIKAPVGIDGPVTPLESAFEEYNIATPVDIRTYYAEVGGSTQVIIQEQQDGQAGDILMRGEYKDVYSAWVLSMPFTTDPLAVVWGEENYEGLAREIATQLAVLVN